jgi:hypothetical protein
MRDFFAERAEEDVWKAYYKTLDEKSSSYFLQNWSLSFISHKMVTAALRG